MPALKAIALSKRYRHYPKPYQRVLEFVTGGKSARGQDVWVLKNVGFELEPGQTLGVIGDNGAGKTTLLKLLSGSTLPTSGRLELHGSVASILELGVGFHSGFNAVENVRLQCALNGLAEKSIAGKTAEILDFTELDPKVIQRPLATYSAGMLMRLAFSAAVCVETDILLVDEILAVGDHYFQRKCIEKIKELIRKGKTLVIASHSLHLVKNLCAQAIWLKEGEARAQGPAPEVVDAYTEEINARERKMLATGAAEKPAETPAEASRLPGQVEGTGEARITRVRIMDETGQERSRFRTREPMTVAVEFEAFRPVTAPIFGVAIHRKDGVYCYGPNTMYDGHTTGTFTGRHTFAIRYESLPLLSGDYFISVAIYDKEHVYPYDWHNQLYAFSMETDLRGDGLILIPHTWKVDAKIIA